jgi:rhodanese-related sulfurtransferase
MSIPELTPVALAERRARGENLVVVDARSAAAWQSSRLRVPGALRVSPDQIDEHAAQLPQGVAVLVAYCTCPHERSSHKVARRLEQLGYGEAYVLKGGLWGWQQAGLPLERKPEVRVELETPPPR